MIRVLIVDDHEGWRRQVRRLLQERSGFQVVGEVSDGLEAVEKAGLLKPDVIVLDIGLPELNGIEVTRQVRQLSPSSKVVILSQENSPEIIDVALSTGPKVMFISQMFGDVFCPLSKLLWPEKTINPTKHSVGGERQEMKGWTRRTLRVSLSRASRRMRFKWARDR